MKTIENMLEIPSMARLQSVLQEHDIDPSAWGDGGTKTVGDLFGEVQAGEAALCLMADRLKRWIWPAHVDVLYEIPSIDVSNNHGRLLRLVEAAQYIPSAQIWRHPKKPTSVSEKRHALQGEEPREAALRGLQEELGVTDPLSLDLVSSEIWPPGQDRHYAGLPTIKQRDYFVAHLRPGEYNPYGYVEHLTDKTTYFYWESINS